MPDYPFGLRPKSVAAILDNTFRLYRRNFKSIALFALLVGGLGQVVAQLASSLLLDGVPVAALQNMVQAYSDMLSGYPNVYGDASSFYRDFGSVMNSSFAAMLVDLLITVFISSFVTGGVIGVAVGYYHGFTDKPAGWLRKTGRIYGRLAVTGFARLLLMGVTYFALGLVVIIVVVLLSLAFLFVPAVPIVIMFVMILAVLLMSAWPELLFSVALVENKFGFKGAGRALSLFFKNFWRMSGVLILTVLLTMLLNLPLSLFTTILPLLGAADFAAASVAGYWVSTILSILVGALTAPLMPIATTLAYLDIRVRREGYDIALRRQDQARQASDPWDGGRS